MLETIETIINSVLMVVGALVLTVVVILSVSFACGWIHIEPSFINIFGVQHMVMLADKVMFTVSW